MWYSINLLRKSFDSSFLEVGQEVKEYCVLRNITGA